MDLPLGQTKRNTLGALVALSLVLLSSGGASGQSFRAPDGSEMVLIPGGSYQMGDTRSEGESNEKPVHVVTLSGFTLGTNEVTVGQFLRFVTETGYKTSAEAPIDRAAQDSLLQLAARGEGLSPSTRQDLVEQTLLYGGCSWWDSSVGRFDFNEGYSWRNPGFQQEEEHPVVCLSWEDAAHYANWVSRLEGLPEAYDVTAGALLDAAGAHTTDITLVVGYRMPTEAEWEYAAREEGRSVRFGNGRDEADSETAAFSAATGDYPYQIKGPERNETEPVGAFSPNALGLFDLAGNAWEWVSDALAPYPDQEVENPVQLQGQGRVIRGGRWGGDAEEMRSTKRQSWKANNRCNASGFRLARSGGM